MAGRTGRGMVRSYPTARQGVFAPVGGGKRPMTERTTTQRHWGVFLALSIAALGSTLGGCNADSYYCPDDTPSNRGLSCQFCDGVGFRPALPPQRAQCRGDFECTTAGQICTNHGCAASCRTSADCARGWLCRITQGATTG